MAFRFRVPGVLLELGFDYVQGYIICTCHRHFQEMFKRVAEYFTAPWFTSHNFRLRVRGEECGPQRPKMFSKVSAPQGILPSLPSLPTMYSDRLSPKYGVPGVWKARYTTPTLSTLFFKTKAFISLGLKPLRIVYFRARRSPNPNPNPKTKITLLPSPGHCKLRLCSAARPSCTGTPEKVRLTLNPGFSFQTLSLDF